MVEKLLTATQNGKSYKITWQHSNGNKTHSFTVNDINRAEIETPMVLKWNGTPLKIKNNGSETLAVPAIGDFKVLNIVPVNDAQQYASVQFSDPIAVGQDLTGLITVSNQSDLSYTINGSEVKLFVGGKLEGNYYCKCKCRDKKQLGC